MTRHVDSTARENDRDEPGFPGPYEGVPLIMVIGKTGSGKSSLVNILGGRDYKTGNTPVISRELDSCTHTASVYTTTIQNREMYLLDTPGFDDSARDNLTILNDIVTELWTLAIEKDLFKIQGIIYLHDIGEARLVGSQRKMWEIVKAICGEDGMKKVVVGTTMWSTGPPNKVESEEAREKEFLIKYWNGIHKTMRVLYDDKESATRIINEVLALPPVILRVQKEMMEPPHSIENTTAGKIALPEGYAEVKRLEKEMEKLKIRHEEMREMEEKLRRKVKEDYAEIFEQRARQLEEEREKMRQEQEAKQREVDDLLEELRKTKFRCNVM